MQALKTTKLKIKMALKITKTPIKKVKTLLKEIKNDFTLFWS